MPKSMYETQLSKIAQDYKAASVSCNSLSGNANDICIADVTGKRDIAQANLEALYAPTERNRYQARVVKAEADYRLASQHCDVLAGNAKDICVKEAKAAEIAAKGHAKALMTTAQAHAAAKTKSNEANLDADKKAGEARATASANDTEANYAVAKEKCQAFAGDAKDLCLSRAKTQFGK